MRRRFLVVSAGLVWLTAACSSGHHVAATTTSTTDAPSPNPYVVPAVITPAYVDAVFKVLNHINGNAVRALIQAGTMTPAVSAEIRAIYGDPLFAIEMRVFQQGLSQDTSNLRRPPGDRITTVQSLIADSPSCIFVKTVSDLTAVELRPTAQVAAEYWVLKPKLPMNDPNHVNPTPWALTYNQDFETATSVPNQC